IQVLVGRISPLAQNFFAAPDEFKTEEETSSLSGTLGVIEEIELKLERTVNVSTAVATHEVVHDQDNLPADPTAEIGSPTESNIRDVAGLVQAVVDSVFRAESTEFPGEDAILRSLGDLKQLLGDILKKALDPLHNPEIKEFPEDADFAVPADESSVITLEDTPRFQPVTV
ncbi:MAG: hypothetical protein VYC17_02340, partial [Nitrospinota bacterium]|nr:hypothetical protein [Nitrospinota bacterium]